MKLTMTLTVDNTSHLLYTNVPSFTLHLLNTYKFDLNGPKRSFIIYSNV